MTTVVLADGVSAAADVEAGDVLVIGIHRELATDTGLKYKQQLEAQLPGVRVLILAGCSGLAVHSKKDAL